MIKIDRLIDNQELDSQDFIDLYKVLPLRTDSQGVTNVGYYDSIRSLLKILKPRCNDYKSALPINEKEWNERSRRVFISALIKNKFPNSPFVCMESFGSKITPSTLVLEYEQYLKTLGSKILYTQCQKIEKHSFSYLFDKEITISFLMGSHFFDSQYRSLVLALNHYYKTQDSKKIKAAIARVRKRLAEYPFHFKQDYYHRETIEDILKLLDNDEYLKKGK